jgi:hypothetical protein
MKTDDILQQIDHLIVLGRTGIAKKQRGSYMDYIPHAEYLAFKAASLSFISLLYGEQHSYYDMFVASINSPDIPTWREYAALAKSAKAYSCPAFR